MSRRTTREAAKAPAPSSTPKLNPGAADDSLRRVLRAASLAVLKHPVASQAAFAALIAEGRRYAETSDGRRWKQSLADAELVRQGGALWAGSVLNTLEDDPGTVLPSTIIDAIAQAARRSDLNAFLQALHRELLEEDGRDP